MKEIVGYNNMAVTVSPTQPATLPHTHTHFKIRSFKRDKTVCKLREGKEVEKSMEGFFLPWM